LRVRTVARPIVLPLNRGEPLPVGRARAALEPVRPAVRARVHQPDRPGRLLRPGAPPAHAGPRLSLVLVSAPRRGAPRVPRADRQDLAVLDGNPGPARVLMR